MDYNCYKCKQTLYGIMIYYVQQGELQSPLMLRVWQYTCFGGPNRWQRAGKWRWIANFITKSLAWKQSFHYNVHYLCRMKTIWIVTEYRVFLASENKRPNDLCFQFSLGLKFNVVCRILLFCLGVRRNDCYWIGGIINV